VIPDHPGPKFFKNTPPVKIIYESDFARKFFSRALISQFVILSAAPDVNDVKMRDALPGSE
jgi:hypothetical protein